MCSCLRFYIWSSSGSKLLHKSSDFCLCLQNTKDIRYIKRQPAIVFHVLSHCNTQMTYRCIIVMCGHSSMGSLTHRGCRWLHVTQASEHHMTPPDCLCHSVIIFSTTHFLSYVCIFASLLSVSLQFSGA